MPAAQREAQSSFVKSAYSLFELVLSLGLIAVFFCFLGFIATPKIPENSMMTLLHQARLRALKAQKPVVLCFESLEQERTRVQLLEGEKVLIDTLFSADYFFVANSGRPLYYSACPGLTHRIAFTHEGHPQSSFWVFNDAGPQGGMLPGGARVRVKGLRGACAP